jgi:transposase
MMEEIASPITTIPGIGYNMGAMIISEIGDFSRFSSPDKALDADAKYAEEKRLNTELDKIYKSANKKYFGYTYHK